MQDLTIYTLGKRKSIKKKNKEQFDNCRTQNSKG